MGIKNVILDNPKTTVRRRKSIWNRIGTGLFAGFLVLAGVSLFSDANTHWGWSIGLIFFGGCGLVVALTETHEELS